MNKSLIEILACPVDKHHPLELYGDEKRGRIKSGALYCSSCGRFYLIIKGIPVMLPDDLRNKNEELDLLEQIPGLPEKITHLGRPWNLNNS